MKWSSGTQDFIQFNSYYSFTVQFSHKSHYLTVSMKSNRVLLVDMK